MLAGEIGQMADVVLPKCLQSLMTAGFMFPSAVDADRAAEVYAFAVGDQPAAALRRVTEKLIRGEYPGHRDFLPKPAEMAAMVREQGSIMRADLRRAREVRAALAEGRERAERPPPTEEAKARVRAMVESVRQAMTAPLEEARGGGDHGG